MSYQLGIDTGGTYTDAVIVDEQFNVIAKTKQLTTPFDLSIGINNAVSALPQDYLKATDLVSLSTTLSTNSVVEGRGAPIAVLLAGYSEKEIEKSGVYELVDRTSVVALQGGHNAMGEQDKPLDIEAAHESITQLKDKVSAFAISSMFGVRNTAHEQKLRDMVLELTDCPVACGHELASGLGAPRRAFTVALNARMIFYVRTLIRSVETILKQKQIKAPLMIVKGDGSLVNLKTALMQPVSTVLSGPAASVVGACGLSGKDNAIVVDIGGTTTDIAIVTDGRPELCDDGAVIGESKPMVEAIRVFSIGLGGDSEARFKGALEISNRRVVPISLLTHQYPHTLDALKHQWQNTTNPRQVKFALPLQSNEQLIARLDDIGLEAWQRLQEGPVELDHLADQNRPLLRAIAHLERIGLAIYTGFTASDAIHVLKMSDHWNAEGAVLGCKIWARQMRNLYGCGDWELGDAVTPSERVFELFVTGVSQKLLEAGLNQHGKLDETRAQGITQLLCDIIMKRGRSADIKPLFNIEFARDYSVIGVGGPAGHFFPPVAKLLNVDLVLPDHGEVANAVGAVMGAVVQTAKVTVTQPKFGIFYVFHRGEPVVFEALEPALARARELVVEEATALAVSAGAGAVNTTIKQDSNHVTNNPDGELFVSTEFTAIATGRPGYGL